MHALDIKQLKKTYRSGVEALKGIDLTVKQGDFFALLGPNGAGKSTTIGIITSLINKTAGYVRIFGHDIDQDFNAAKRCLGVVPQEFNFSIFDKAIHVLMNQAGYYGIDRKLAYQRAEYYLKKLELWHKRDATPRELSGGQKRRLMIARALLHEPKLLILDEPTAGVDIEIRRSMWDFITDINAAGTTVILTTHYLEEAESLCRDIAIIDHGVIVENSSMKDLLQKLNIATFVINTRNTISITPELTNYSCRLIDESTLEVDVHSNQNMNDLFTALTKNKIQVTSMRNKANRLETLFLDLIQQPKNKSNDTMT